MFVVCSCLCRIDSEAAHDIAQYAAEGKTALQIARLTGIERTTVWKRMKKMAENNAERHGGHSLRNRSATKMKIESMNSGEENKEDMSSKEEEDEDEEYEGIEEKREKKKMKNEDDPQKKKLRKSTEVVKVSSLSFCSSTCPLPKDPVKNHDNTNINNVGDSNNKRDRRERGVEMAERPDDKQVYFTFPLGDTSGVSDGKIYRLIRTVLHVDGECVGLDKYGCVVLFSFVCVL